MIAPSAVPQNQEAYYNQPPAPVSLSSPPLRPEAYPVGPDFVSSNQYQPQYQPTAYPTQQNQGFAPQPAPSSQTSQIGGLKGGVTKGEEECCLVALCVACCAAICCLH